jgi:hypothetical protein
MVANRQTMAALRGSSDNDGGWGGPGSSGDRIAGSNAAGGAQSNSGGGAGGGAGGFIYCAWDYCPIDHRVSPARGASGPPLQPAKELVKSNATSQELMGHTGGVIAIHSLSG